MRAADLKMAKQEVGFSHASLAFMHKPVRDCAAMTNLAGLDNSH